MTTYLGLPSHPPDVADIIVLPVPYELTTSYRTGTEEGPLACLEASAQVETYHPPTRTDLEGFRFHTAASWASDRGTLVEQLSDMSKWFASWFQHSGFPLILGGEHGILPAIVRAWMETPPGRPLERLTIVQIDAHADLREDLDGERHSHACAAARALDSGATDLLQVGIRAFSMEEHERIESDARISTWFARDLFAPSSNGAGWRSWLEALKTVEGPVHLTIDVDGLCPSLVPGTGTPVPGGLAYWHAVETIQAIFSAPRANVISADLNEIAPESGGVLTAFTAASLAAEITACHLAHGRTLRES